MRIFGLEIFEPKKTKREEEKVLSNSFTAPDDLNGAVEVEAGGISSASLSLDASFSNQNDAITHYRKMADTFEVDNAVSDIVNEAISTTDEDKSVDIMLDKTEFSESIKEKIREEFDYMLQLLDFDTNGYDIFKNWYVDGRLYFHKIIDINQPKKGILRLNYLDPRNIKLIREVTKRHGQEHDAPKSIDEYYLYDESLHVPAHKKNAFRQTNHALKIAKDSICFVHSGLLDAEKNIIRSHLHKAIKPLNQLSSVEDSLVIYRLSRAPERRIFYIDVGSMPKTKAEEYLNKIMGRYRNTIRYDSSTGSVNGKSAEMTMMEDYWLPRREGGKGTEISTLPGGQNLGDIEDIIYFQRRLYKSLNVPISRLEGDGSFNLGRTTEITRDELKFSKFVSRLRRRFNDLFNDLIKTQLILTRVITLEEWEENCEKIRYDYLQDFYMTEQKNAELLRDRVALLEEVATYEGKYYSRAFIRKNILQQTEEDIKIMDKEIAEETKAGIYDTEEEEEF